MTTTTEVDLSPKQERVLEAIQLGLPYWQIAERLGISERTVRAYVDLLRRKFGEARGRPVKTGRELIPLATEWFAANG
jgi:DNA-binding NarL/FixJ family response regulator